MAGLAMALLMLRMRFNTVVTDIGQQPGNTSYAAAFCKQAGYPFTGAGLQGFMSIALHKGFAAMPAQIALVACFCFAVLYSRSLITNTFYTLNRLLLHYRHFKGVKNKPGNHIFTRKFCYKN
jgi:hypothetical protein